MADRLAKLLKTIGTLDGVVLMTGGLALDEGLVAAMQEAMAKEKVTFPVRSHPEFDLCRRHRRGALGRVPPREAGASRRARRRHSEAGRLGDFSEPSDLGRTRLEPYPITGNARPVTSAQEWADAHIFAPPPIAMSPSPACGEEGAHPEGMGRVRVSPHWLSRTNENVCHLEDTTDTSAILTAAKTAGTEARYVGARFPVTHASRSSRLSRRRDQFCRVA